MKLVSITIENYRSITKAHKIRLGNATTLVGPNNEGKSNILRALVTAMNVISRARSAYTTDPRLSTRYIRYAVGGVYEWHRDFPMHLQDANPTGVSTIILEFELNETDTTEFRDRIGSDINGTLPLRIKLGGHHETSVSVAKPGPGAKALSSKVGKIAAFVAERLDFQHIPAVRTASSSVGIVQDLVERELAPLETNKEYLQALAKIADIQKPILSKLSETIRETLSIFLPAVKNVAIQIQTDERNRVMRRSCEVIVDDGTPTLLQHKGDGVQSLVALGLMRHVSTRSAKSKNLVIAVEEPESHLHPLAMHDLHKVLLDLSAENQIVITTHSPLFVNRMAPESNIIVLAQKARPAKSIEEVRQTLGVKASDNLKHAELVLLVEGEDDRKALASLLGTISKPLADAIETGALSIDTMGGASNIVYKLGLIRDALCAMHVFLDYDLAGRKAYDDAKAQGLLTEAEITFARLQGRKETELEDLYDAERYRALLMNRYGVSIDHPKFKATPKWSIRMRDIFTLQGKPWDDRVEMELKQAIANAVVDDPTGFVRPERRNSLDALSQALQWRLKISEDHEDVNEKAT